jgi:hypothetical protein
MTKINILKKLIPSIVFLLIGVVLFVLKYFFYFNHISGIFVDISCSSNFYFIFYIIGLMNLTNFLSNKELLTDFYFSTIQIYCFILIVILLLDKGIRGLIYGKFFVKTHWVTGSSAHIFSISIILLVLFTFFAIFVFLIKKKKKKKKKIPDFKIDRKLFIILAILVIVSIVMSIEYFVLQYYLIRA